jgi:transcriptional regulator with XRE-family HTH domain
VTRRDIADALKRQREELGITVVEAVRRTKVSRSTWRDLEAERRPGISAPVGVKLDKFLDWPAGTTVRIFRENEPACGNGARAVRDEILDREDEMIDQIAGERTATVAEGFRAATMESVAVPASTPATASQVVALWLPVLLRLTPEQHGQLMTRALDLALERHG